MRRMTKLLNLNDPGWGRGNANDPQKPEPTRQEPPRRPNNQDGPPDLDQVWRDFNRKLKGLFGNKGGGPRRPWPPQPPESGGSGSGGPTPRQTKFGFGIVGAVVVLLWLGSGFFIVQEGQVGVITQFGAYKSTAAPGFQWRMPYPIQQTEMVDVSQLRTFEIGYRGNARNKVPPEALMLTSDENIVDVQFVVQYRVKPDGAPDYLFETRDPDQSVNQVAQSSMREVVGRSLMDFVLYEGRTQVASDVQRSMQEVLDRYKTGILVSAVAIQNVQPPEQVQAAFDDAVKAGQDRERQINEGEAYRNQVVPLAQGTASRMLEQAEGYKAKVIGDARGNTARFLSILEQYLVSPNVQRERMYLDTMQDMFARSSKVFIDTEASNSMLYLPLDRIMQQSARGAAGSSSIGMSDGMSGQSGSSSGSGSNSSSTNSSSNTSNTNSNQRPSLRETFSGSFSRDRNASR
ncbi:MAG TPA: FtsH protease activity modulator HflK [Orrella sp.]